MTITRSVLGRLCSRAAATLMAGLIAATAALAADPIKIGFSMAQSGPLAGSGKSALLAMKIWAEHQNAPRAGCSVDQWSSPEARPQAA